MSVFALEVRAPGMVRITTIERRLLVSTIPFPLFLHMRSISGAVLSWTVCYESSIASHATSCLGFRKNPVFPVMVGWRSSHSAALIQMSDGHTSRALDV
jgi:hypothetical protein